MFHRPARPSPKCLVQPRRRARGGPSRGAGRRRPPPAWPGGLGLRVRPRTQSTPGEPGRPGSSSIRPGPGRPGRRLGCRTARGRPAGRPRRLHGGIYMHIRAYTLVYIHKRTYTCVYVHIQLHTYIYMRRVEVRRDNVLSVLHIPGSEAGCYV